MKLAKITAIAAIAAATVVGHASAQVATFDEFGSGCCSGPGSYIGLDWSGYYVFGPFVFGYGDTGYGKVMQSPDNVAFVQSSFPSDMTPHNHIRSTSGTFTFNDGYFAAAWDAHKLVGVEGYYNSTLLYATVLELTNTEATFAEFNWTGINDLRFVNNTGTSSLWITCGSATSAVRRV